MYLNGLFHKGLTKFQQPQQKLQQLHQVGQLVICFLFVDNKENERERERYREIQRETEKKREKETKIEIQRETEKKREKETKIEKETKVKERERMIRLKHF